MSSKINVKTDKIKLVRTSLANENEKDVKELNLFKFFEKIISKKEYEDLKSHNLEGVPILTDTGNVLELISMLKKKDFTFVINFVKSCKNKKDLIWNQWDIISLEARIDKEIANSRLEIAGVEGIGKCKYCNYEKLLVRTKQTRSGDEGITTFSFCPRCKSSW